MINGNPIVQMHDVSKRFGKIQALDKIDREPLKFIAREVRGFFGDKKPSHLENTRTLSLTLQAEPFLTFLQEVTDSNWPLTAARINLLLSKLMFGWSKLESLWNISSFPFSQYPFIRVLLRAFMGFNFNLKKLSYWSFPTISHELFGFYFGKVIKICVNFCD